MIKFKPGDRVAVYGNSQAGALEAKESRRNLGEVVTVCADYNELDRTSKFWVNVKLYNGVTYTFHHKQLRKLVKRQPKPFCRFNQSHCDCGGRK